MGEQLHPRVRMGQRVGADQFARIPYQQPAGAGAVRRSVPSHSRGSHHHRDRAARPAAGDPEAVITRKSNERTADAPELEGFGHIFADRDRKVSDKKYHLNI